MSDPLGAKIAEKRGEVSDPRKTTPERARQPGAPGSLGFAAAVAVPCLVASLGLGLGTIYVPRLFEDDPPVAAEPSGTTSSRSWSTTGATTTRDATPAGHFRYTGPAGLSTVLPDSFAVLDGNTTVTARNPLDPTVEVRFGGAPPEGYADLFDTITAAAGTSANRPGYRQLVLERTRHDDREAVDWEFRYETPSGEVRRSRSHYWREGGIEYVLLVQAPPERWAEAARLLDTMIDYSDTP